MTQCNVSPRKLFKNNRVLVGFDFPFGYPVGVAGKITCQESALNLWDWLDREIEDNFDNTNNRFHVASKINKIYGGHGPFWGKPQSSCYPLIPKRGNDRERSHDHPPERRIADKEAKGAKTVWQLFYSGCGGSQVLVGLPAVNRLRKDERIASHAKIWPLETGLCLPNARVVFAEVYPSLLNSEVEELNRPDEIRDRAQVHVTAMAFARLDASGGLEALFGGASGLTDEQRRIIEREEAWILGLGHESELAGALVNL